MDGVINITVQLSERNHIQVAELYDITMMERKANDFKNCGTLAVTPQSPLNNLYNWF